MAGPPCLKGRTSGTKERAGSAAGIQTGCPDGCACCHAKGMAIRFGRKTAETGKDPEPGAAPARCPRGSGTVMFPSSQDITDGSIGSVSCARRICSGFSSVKERIGFTVGSSGDAVLRLREPGAPLFEERIDALRTAWQAGWKKRSRIRGACPLRGCFYEKASGACDCLEDELLPSALIHCITSAFPLQALQAVIDGNAAGKPVNSDHMTGNLLPVMAVSIG